MLRSRFTIQNQHVKNIECFSSHKDRGQNSPKTYTWDYKQTLMGQPIPLDHRPPGTFLPWLRNTKCLLTTVESGRCIKLICTYFMHILKYYRMTMHSHPKIPRIGQMFEHQFLYWVPFLEDPITSSLH